MRFSAKARAAGAVLTLLAAATAAPAPAGAADNGTIAYRKAVMRALGGHMAAMAAIVQGRGGDMADLPDHAQSVARLAHISEKVFPQSSSAAAGDTAALDQIWDNPREFKAVQEAFTYEADRLAAVAPTGNARVIAAQLGVVGKQACKSCHTHFRKEAP
ncbi:MAG: cytochrome c [Hyphomicrobiales bacterium]|nr:cytochrome c [Hyphomicrobiales bacterium]